MYDLRTSIYHFPSTGGTVLNYLANPITPQANLAPEFPVVEESGC